MTPDEQLALVQKHYALNSAGDRIAAQALVTDDFVLEIPACMPFAGTYRGKGALDELIPVVAGSVGLAKLEFLATTVGDGLVIELCQFTFAGAEDAPTQVTEVNFFRDGLISEIRPFYHDPDAFVAAAARRAAAV